MMLISLGDLPVDYTDIISNIAVNLFNILLERYFLLELILVLFRIDYKLYNT